MFHKSQRHCTTTITALLEHTPGYPSLYGLVDIACKFHSWLVTNYYKWNKPTDCCSVLDMHQYRQLSQTQTTWGITGPDYQVQDNGSNHKTFPHEGTKAFFPLCAPHHSDCHWPAPLCYQEYSCQDYHLTLLIFKWFKAHSFQPNFIQSSLTVINDGWGSWYFS